MLTCFHLKQGIIGIYFNLHCYTALNQSLGQGLHSGLLLNHNEAQINRIYICFFFFFNYYCIYWWRRNKWCTKAGSHSQGVWSNRTLCAFHINSEPAPISPSEYWLSFNHFFQGMAEKRKIQPKNTLTLVSCYYMLAVRWQC